MNRNALIFFALTFCILGCSQKKTATISGQLENISDKSINISIGADPRTGLKTLDNAMQCEIREDGSFSFFVEHTYPVSLTLVSENYEFVTSIFLLNDGEIHITADCDSTFNTIVYSGDNGSLNNIYHEWIRLNNKVTRELRAEELTYNQWVQGLDSLEIISNTMLQEYVRENPLSKKGRYWLNSVVKYRKYSALLSRAYKSNSEPGSLDFSFFEELDLTDHKAAEISSSYNNLIQRYILHQVNEEGVYYEESGDNEEFFELWYQLAKEELRGKVRDVVLCILVTDLLSRNETCAEDYYQKFVVDCQSRELRNIAEALYSDYIGLVETDFDKGIEFISTNDRSPKDVLSSFEGKVLYLDFWASWCSPCLRSIPHTMNLANHYQNRDVVVLFVGHRDQRSSLENAIKKHGIIGKHVILDQKETDTWRDEFEVGSIPSYVLLDSEQSVVALNAPHPESPLLIDMIDSLLIEK